MSGHGDYPDEMGIFSRVTDDDVERLIAGRAPDGESSLSLVAELLAEARGALLARPDEATELVHLSAISGASRTLTEKGEPVVRRASKAHGPEGQASGLPKWRRAMYRTKSFALKAAAGTVAAGMSMMGFAYAGVDLPGTAVARALQAVTGVDLPNQGAADGAPGKSVADDVRDVIDNSGLEGCELGQAVAAAARANSQDAANRQDAAHRAEESTAGEDACDNDEQDSTEPRGSRATGQEKSAEGGARATEAQGSKATGDEASADGRATADDASGEAQGSQETGDEASSNAQENNPSSGSDSGQGTGDEASSNAQEHNPSSGSDSGQQTGDEASSSGQEKNPTGNGRP